MIQLTDKYWAVEVPDGAENIRVSQLIGSPKLFADLPGVLWAVKLPPGSYRFLFTTKTATEEDARKVVDEHKIRGNVRYEDYTREYMWQETAIESLRSLLRSKGLEENKNYVLIEKTK